MKPARTALVAVALSASAFAHASEITEFVFPTASVASRADVQAEARQRIANPALNHNFAGPAQLQAPVSTRSRDEVRREVSRLRRDPQAVAGSYYIGGM